MNFKTILRAFTTTLALALCVAGIGYSQAQLWPLTRQHFADLGNNPGYVPRAAEIRPLLLGFDHFAADLYWLRAVQYVGSNALASDFSALPAYFNLIIDLDPNFQFVTKFAAMSLPLNETTREALPDLLLKAIETHPENGQTYVDLGFYYYYYAEDIDEAVYWYKTCAATVADCPKFASTVAASLESRAGRYAVALQTWLAKAENIDDLSEYEQGLVGKKLSENIKLIALSCAADHYRAAGNTLRELSDLRGQSIGECAALPTPLVNQFGARYGLPIINDTTLTNDAFEANDFIWDAAGERVKTISW